MVLICALSFIMVGSGEVLLFVQAAIFKDNILCGMCKIA